MAWTSDLQVYGERRRLTGPTGRCGMLLAACSCPSCRCWPGRDPDVPDHPLVLSPRGSPWVGGTRFSGSVSPMSLPSLCSSSGCRPSSPPCSCGPPRPGCPRLACGLLAADAALLAVMVGAGSAPFLANLWKDYGSYRRTYHLTGPRILAGVSFPTGSTVYLNEDNNPRARPCAGPDRHRGPAARRRVRPGGRLVGHRGHPRRPGRGRRRALPGRPRPAPPRGLDQLRPGSRPHGLRPRLGGRHTDHRQHPHHGRATPRDRDAGAPRAAVRRALARRHDPRRHIHRGDARTLGAPPVAGGQAGGPVPHGRRDRRHRGRRAGRDSHPLGAGRADLGAVGLQPRLLRPHGRPGIPRGRLRRVGSDRHAEGRSPGAGLPWRWGGSGPSEERF